MHLLILQHQSPHLSHGPHHKVQVYIFNKKPVMLYLVTHVVRTIDQTSFIIRASDSQALYPNKTNKKISNTSVSKQSLLLSSKLETTWNLSSAYHKHELGGNFCKGRKECQAIPARSLRNFFMNHMRPASLSATNVWRCVQSVKNYSYWTNCFMFTWFCWAMEEASRFPVGTRGKFWASAGHSRKQKQQLSSTESGLWWSTYALLLPKICTFFKSIKSNFWKTWSTSWAC